MDHARRIEEMARQLRDVRDPVREPGNRSPWMAAVQRWQAERLAASFSDLAGDPRFARATRFFLQDLYGEQDVAWRDRDVVRILPTMRRWLPERLIAAVAQALELDLATHRLDLALAAELEKAHGLQRQPRLDLARYIAAYRTSSTPESRQEQLGLLLGVGAELDRLARNPVLGGLLKVARAPARAAGLDRMQRFLEEGFAACRAMGRDGAEFLSRIGEREAAALERLFEGDADPFTPRVVRRSD